MLSAAINEYELITFYNWHKTGNKMAKISGGLEYMSKLDSSHDEELLLIVDGFDEWFQLPASIMEARYHDINRRENERILSRTGRPYKQSIVISTQRQCWPGNSADIACYAAPESPLPGYVFGPETDSMVDGWNKYSKLRPRYMNAGFTMGPVKELRELWNRAQQYAEDNPNAVGLDQNILARIWGEQNYVREAARFNDEPLTDENLGNSPQAALKDSKESNNRRASVVKRDLGFPEDESTPARKRFVPRINTTYEFGIGLDYGSELSLATVFAEYDADWLVFSNKTNLTTAFNAQNVSRPGATHLQNDIANLPSEQAPFASLQTPPTAELKKALREVAAGATWQDVPLFTSMWTGITPVIVHHNAWRDNLKDRRQTTWDKMWYQPYARQLLDAWAHPATRTAPPKVGASAKFRRMIGGSSKATKPDPPRIRELGAKTDNDREGNWVRWGDLCTEAAQKEVFRDGEGVWVGPGGAAEKKLSAEEKKEKEAKEKEKEAEEGVKSMIMHNEPVR